MTMSKIVRRFALCLVAMSSTGTAFAGMQPSHVSASSPELSAADWSSIRAAHEAGRRSVVATAGEYEATNPGQQWRTRFDARGFLVHPDQGNWSWGLELVSYGFAGHECAVDTPAGATAMGERLVYERDDTVTEWYVNDERGLEHGYTIHRRPTGALTVTSPGASLETSPGTNLLRLTIAVRGDLSAQLQNGGRDVRFADAAGAAVLHYSGLTVVGANGSAVPAWFELSAGHLNLMVDDAGAAYPLTIDPLAQQAYIKASNTGGTDQFGYSVAMSGDTLVVGAHGEDSNAAGVNGNQNNNDAGNSGAAYVFVRDGATWTQQAYLKASNPEANDDFGFSVAISGDTIVVGAFMEDSSATGVDGDQVDNGAQDSGAAYVFVREGTTWSQQAYLKASNTGQGDWYGTSVAVDGDTVVVGAYREASNATGVNGDGTNNDTWSAGAAYVYVREGPTWSQQAYLKASNTELHDEFGFSVEVLGDTIVIGASDEDSNATGVNGNQNDNTGQSSGAAFVFVRNGATWTQQAYLKASNTGIEDFFGISVAMSGETVVVGAYGEGSNATGVNGDQSNNGAVNAGAAYVFVRNGATWSQQAYLKASNTGEGDQFGTSVSISGDTVVVGAFREDSIATGMNGDQANNDAGDAGAAYIFVRDGATWTQQTYLKASNTGANDHFGESVVVLGDTLVVGARFEDSSAKGVNGNQGSNGSGNSGAVYVFTGLDVCPGDADGDDVCDDVDNCPVAANPSQDDSDGDGTGDACDECAGFDDNVDSDSDGIPDGCDQPADFNNDGAVDGADLGLLLGQWGRCGGCAGDLTGDGNVDGADLGILLGAWTGF